jgi:hypothetical protein
MKNYYIQINGLTDTKAFVEIWSKIYNYRNDHKYTDNIENGLENDQSLKELFNWKNGTNDSISERKNILVDEFIANRKVFKNMKINFRIEEFEKLIRPDEKAAVWKIFLLHIIQPDEYPIFDQHVCRSFNFFTKGVLEEILISQKEKYNIYKNKYVCWFNELKITHGLNARDMDKAFFMFGRTLKLLNSETIKIL